MRGVKGLVYLLRRWYNTSASRNVWVQFFFSSCACHEPSAYADALNGSRTRKSDAHVQHAGIKLATKRRYRGLPAKPSKSLPAIRHGAEYSNPAAAACSKSGTATSAYHPFFRRKVGQLNTQQVFNCSDLIICVLGLSCDNP